MARRKQESVSLSCVSKRKSTVKGAPLREDREDSTDSLNSWRNQGDKQEVQVCEDETNLMPSSGAGNLTP